MSAATRAGCFFLLLTSAVAEAHHGRDFLLTQTAHLPAQGGIYAIARQDFVDQDDEEEWEFEPAVLGSVTDWLTLEVHSHIEKVKGESTEYEATAAAGYFRFTPRGAALAVGAAIEYELSNRSDDEDVWEFAGTFEDDKEGEVLLGVFVDPLPWLTINVGIGTGFNNGADLALRSAFVFRLR